MTNKSILVVEDDKELQEAIKIKLQEKGLNFEQVETGEGALKLLADKPFDLVWLDIFLPGIDGFEVLKRIREDEKLKDLPVIVVSASGDTESMEKAMQMKVSNYIVKSNYKLSEIIDIVIAILEMPAAAAAQNT